MTIHAPFQWERQPLAEKVILTLLERACASSASIANLSEALLKQTNTRLFDWLDHVTILESAEMHAKLQEVGFTRQESGKHPVYYHPGAQLPRLVLHTSKESALGLAVSVDSIDDFLMVRGEHRSIEGSRFGNFRRCLFSLEKGIALWIVERRGAWTIQPLQEKAGVLETYGDALEKWMTRPRPLNHEDQAMEETLRLTKALIQEVGQDRAAWTVLEGERRYWQARNTAGQTQKCRQDRLGMGWANHDHHTFRSSRRRFTQLVQLFEWLGFHCRERFYAGEDAGWGAQVMENPACRLVLFLDVDLAPGEIANDFAHEPLPELDKLGTVGLWCALHGDSILKSGMHHLEAQFMFEELTKDLAEKGIQMMNPFSSFTYLRQAFTVGEHWPVDPARVQELLQQGKITSDQAERFLSHGALGSHLENLQRREGFKGFNQKSVSQIIKRTDPRLKEN